MPSRPKSKNAEKNASETIVIGFKYGLMASFI
jgi:hypothetical protein